MIKTKLLGAAAILLLSAGAAAAVPAVARSDLNVRSGPGTEYGVVGVIQSGETVDLGRCIGSWCRVAFGGGSGYANRSFLQIAAGAPGAGVVVQAPVYDPYDYDYDYDYGYAYGPGVGFYAGPRFRYRHDGHSWRGGWQGPGRSAGNWQQGRPWQGGQGARIGAGVGRPQPGVVDSAAGARVSAPAAMPSTPAGGARGAAAPAAPGGGAAPRQGVR
jgi:Bacterial SH3 domain